VPTIVLGLIIGLRVNHSTKVLALKLETNARIISCLFPLFLHLRELILQVYVTMYLNDCQRTAFYEGIGLNTKEFDMHVIIEVRLMVYTCLLCT
jgi:hypothetical protein